MVFATIQFYSVNILSTFPVEGFLLGALGLYKDELGAMLAFSIWTPVGTYRCRCEGYLFIWSPFFRIITVAQLLAVCMPVPTSPNNGKSSLGKKQDRPMFITGFNKFLVDSVGHCYSFPPYSIPKPRSQIYLIDDETSSSIYFWFRCCYHTPAPIPFQWKQYMNAFIQ